MISDVQKIVPRVSRALSLLAVALEEIGRAERHASERESPLSLDTFRSRMSDLERLKPEALAVVRELRDATSGPSDFPVMRLDPDDVQGLWNVNALAGRIQWMIELGAASPDWLRKVLLDMSSIERGLAEIVPRREVSRHAS